MGVQRSCIHLIRSRRRPHAGTGSERARGVLSHGSSDLRNSVRVALEEVCVVGAIAGPGVTGRRRTIIYDLKFVTGKDGKAIRGVIENPEATIRAVYEDLRADGRRNL